MNLLGELFFAEFVEDVELAGENDVVDEATASQLHADDDLPVRNHHSNGPEVDFEILWKLLSTGISRVLTAKRKGFRHQHTQFLPVKLGTRRSTCRCLGKATSSKLKAGCRS